MNCPKCDGETHEATLYDTPNDEGIGLGWFFCVGTETQPSCGWSDQEDQELEDRRDLEKELLR